MQAIERNVPFTITGEFITTQARAWVKEGAWQKAIDFLIESVCGFTYDLAIAICSGKKKMIGNSHTGIDLEEDSDHELTKSLEWQYAGYLSENGIEYYQPYAYVDNWGENDIGACGPATLAIKYCGIGGQRDLSYRSWHYVDSKNDAIFSCDKVNHPDVLYPVVILFKRVDAPPIWMRNAITKKSTDAFNQFIKIRGLPESRGHIQWYGNKPVFGEKGEPFQATSLNPYGHDEKGNPLNKETFKEFDERKGSLFANSINGIQNAVRACVEIVDGNNERAKKILSPKYILEPDTKLKGNYGWLLPNGDFYACPCTRHGEYAYMLINQLYGNETDNPEESVEERWIKITYDPIDNDKVLILIPNKVTQKQRDTLFDWCQKHNEKMPDFIE